MQIKRAETRDVPAIKQLIKGGFGRDDMEKALKRRYGDAFNLYQLIDTCPLSFVCIDKGVVAFISLMTCPSSLMPPVTNREDNERVQLHEIEWDEWIRSNYKCQSVKVY